jgi:hypothetical protein
VCWSPDGSKLAASNWDHSISVWEGTDRSTPQAKQQMLGDAQARQLRWHVQNGWRNWRDATMTPQKVRQLDQLTGLDAPTQLHRGELFGWMGRWEQAAADHAAGLKGLTGFSSTAWRKHALFRLWRKDGPGYRQLRETLLRRYADERSAEVCAEIVLACCADPSGAGRDRRITALVQTIEAEQRPKAWSLHAAAVGHLRAGRWTEAISSAEWSLRRAVVWKEPCDGVNWHVLAQAHQQLGNKEKAQQCWKKGHAWHTEKAAQSNRTGVAPGIYWANWLWAKLLHAETEKMMK